MSNRAIRIVAVTSTILLLALVGLNLWGLSLGDEGPPSEIYSVDLDCPSGTTEYTSPGNAGEWVGWYRTCVQNHGPFYLWRAGKLVLKGSFVDGKREGTFTSYDENGRMVRSEHYVDGKQVSGK
jgi:hypothetical protein